jgi:hypothetical protein
MYRPHRLHLRYVASFAIISSIIIVVWTVDLEYFEFFKKIFRPGLQALFAGLTTSSKAQSPAAPASVNVGSPSGFSFISQAAASTSSPSTRTRGSSKGTTVTPQPTQQVRISYSTNLLIGVFAYKYFFILSLKQTAEVTLLQFDDFAAKNETEPTADQQTVPANKSDLMALMGLNGGAPTPAQAPTPNAAQQMAMHQQMMGYSAQQMPMPMPMQVQMNGMPYYVTAVAPGMTGMMPPGAMPMYPGPGMMYSPQQVSWI